MIDLAKNQISRRSWIHSCDELFGSTAKIALMKRAANLWALLCNDPRYAYYGRLVALSDPSDDAADILSALAKLQGAAVCYFFPKSSVDGLYSELEGRGLTTDRHEHYWGGKAALHASRDALASHTLPSDITISTIDPDTPREFLTAVAELCLLCGVMPVPGPVMRGQVQRGLCLVAIDRSGCPVASASSYMIHHHSSQRANDAFWGMLATREDRRGEKIALVLGAHAIVHMWENHGARGFMTGVRSDNPSSQALCGRLGVGPTDWVYAECFDPALLDGSTITK